MVIVASFPAGAQFSREKFEAEPGLFFGSHHSYVFKEAADTPAPEGYEPVYISHIGRHGSRRNTSDSNINKLVSMLEKARELDILTPAGDTLLAHVYIYRELSDGMYGMLSERGGREHQEIAVRMYRRFPSVFKHPGRKKVFAVSSQSERCIVSMAYFAEALKGIDPELQIDMRTGERYMRYVMKSTPDLNEQIRKQISPHVAEMRKENIDDNRLLHLLFTDVNAARKKCDVKGMAGEIYSLCNYSECLDLVSLGTVNLLTFDELYSLSRAASNRLYTLMCNSVEYGDLRIKSADDLLRDFVQKADEALSGKSGHVADLRFSHDYGILPLLSLIGTKGMDVRSTLREADKYWCAGEMIPMATNLQMVFYAHPDKGDILVKLLHNEQETSIPALSSDVGPYYRWDRLRAYLSNKY